MVKIYLCWPLLKTILNIPIVFEEIIKINMRKYAGISFIKKIWLQTHLKFKFCWIDRHMTLYVIEILNLPITMWNLSTFFFQHKLEITYSYSYLNPIVARVIFIFIFIFYAKWAFHKFGEYEQNTIENVFDKIISFFSIFIPIDAFIIVHINWIREISNWSVLFFELRNCAFHELNVDFLIW